MTSNSKCCSSWICHICGNADLIYGGSVKGHWYCVHHWSRADSQALVDDFPQYYHLNKRGLAVGNI